MKHRLTARRAGAASVLSLNLPKPLSAALPPGNHLFDAEFTDEGILLTYVGPAAGNGRKRGVIEEPPKWVLPEGEGRS